MLFNTPLRRLIALYRTGGSSKGVVKTVTGAIVHVTDALRKNAKKVVCYINPVQTGSGDPSPENVRPITGWTGVNVYRTGKNLFTITGESTGLYIDVNGSIAPSTTGWNCSDYIPVTPNTQYTFEPNTRTGNSAKSWFYDANKNGISYIDSGQQTFTTPSNCYYMRFSYRDASTNIQLELGSTATDYEPYQGTTKAITWQTEGGTVYGGTLDVTNGVLTVDRASVDMGTLNWVYSSPNNLFYAIVSDKINNRHNSGLISNYKMATTNPGSLTAASGILSEYMAALSKNTSNPYIYVRDSSYNGNSDVFITAMRGQTLVYELATPVTDQLTPTQIQMLLGENNLWHDGNGNLELTYLATA